MKSNINKKKEKTYERQGEVKLDDDESYTSTNVSTAGWPHFRCSLIYLLFSTTIN